MGTVLRRVIPTRGSKRGERARPESTTTEIPSTVRLDSAMSVESTTFRKGGSDGEIAASCSSTGREPCRRRTSARLSASRSATRRISAIPGRNTSTSPSWSARADRTTEATCTSICRVRGGGGRHCRSTWCIRASAAMTGTSPRNSAMLVESMVADITNIRRSGRNPALLSRIKANPRSVWRFRSWTSSKMRSAVPASEGSAWILRVRIPSVTTSMRVASLVARSWRVT
ncbi:hypothetical protein BH23ACT5_BH23ACT5_00980 [soil metagenome]